MRADDVVFLGSPLTFDPSVVDLFLALSSGAQVLIVPSVMKKMPKRLAHLLFTAHKTTVLQVNVKIVSSFLEHCNALLFTTGHTHAARPIWGSYLETGSAVVCLLAAGVGSGWRVLPFAGSAEGLEAPGQQDQHLQCLWYHGGVLLGQLLQNTRVSAAE